MANPKITTTHTFLEMLVEYKEKTRPNFGWHTRATVVNDNTKTCTWQWDIEHDDRRAPKPVADLAKFIALNYFQH